MSSIPFKSSPVLLTEKEVADYLGFSIRTVQKWRLIGSGPPFIRASTRAVRYRYSDLKQWLETRVRNSTSDTRDEI